MPETESNQNQTLNRTRSKRWNRRSSDGAAWNSFEGENDDDGTQRQRSCCALAWQRIPHGWSNTIFSHEPIQITAEFRNRISSAARASFVTFVTFTLLIFSGQGELVNFSLI